MEALGTDIAGKLTHHECWIAAFANILFQRGILSHQDLARKMADAEARWPADPGVERTSSARP